MRASILIALIGLCSALSVAVNPPIATAIANWQEAIKQLHSECERAETCLDQLRQHGDAYRITQGELFYEVAKAQMDQANKDLQAALAGKPTADNTKALEAQIDQVIEGRLKLCGLFRGDPTEARG